MGIELLLNEGLTISDLVKQVNSNINKDNIQTNIDDLNVLLSNLDTLKNIALTKKERMIQALIEPEMIVVTKPEKESKYGDINWLCEFLGVEKQTVYGYNNAKKFPFIKKGKKVMYDKAEIMELVTQTRSKTMKEIKEEALQGLTRLRKAG